MRAIEHSKSGSAGFRKSRALCEPARRGRASQAAAPRATRSPIAASIAIAIAVLAAAVSPPGEAAMRGGVRSWVGNDTTNNWSNGGNWDGNDDIANWSQLVFSGSEQLSNFNNLPNADNLNGIGTLGVAKLTFSNSGSYPYTLNGNAFILGSQSIAGSGGLVNSTNWFHILKTPVIVGSSQQWSAGTSNTTGLIVDGGVTFSTALSSRITVTGTGNLISRGNIANATSFAHTLNMPIIVGGSGVQTWDGGQFGLTISGRIVLGEESTLTLTANTSSLCGSGSWNPNLCIPYVRDQVSSTGSLVVKNRINLNATGVLAVGESFAYAVRLESGSTLNTSSLILGWMNAGSGTLTLTGAGTLVNAIGVSVGQAGLGSLNIEDQARLQSTTATLGQLARSGGTNVATITGIGSSWITTGLVVGRSGTGELRVQPGGYLQSVDSAIANDSGSNGSVSISGVDAVWSAEKGAGLLTVGNSGRGTLSIANEGLLRSGPQSWIGKAAGGSGTVNVTGERSRWESNGDVFVGVLGIGVLNIADKGRMTSSFLNIGGDNASGGGAGIVNVTDSGSLLQVHNTLRMLATGGTATSTLNIRSGARVEAIALLAGANAIVNIDGGTLKLTNSTTPGTFNWSTGTIEFREGAGLGRDLLAGAGPVLNLGPGKNLSVAGTLAVDTGTLLAIAGGTLTTGGISLGGGTIFSQSAIDLGSTGNLSGRGTVMSRIEGPVGRSIEASGGTLTLGDASRTGAYDFGGQLKVGSQQVILLSADKARLGSSTSIGDGGRLVTVNGADLAAGRTMSFTGNAAVQGNFTNNGSVVRDGPAGTLSFFNDVNGAGSFGGDIVFRAGFNPGNSPATVNHGGGDVTFDSTSVLTMEILGSAPGTQYDQLVGINKLTFNGRLALTFGNGFAPGAGSSFALFGFQSFAGSFAPDRIDVAGFDRAQLDFSSLGQNGTLSVAAVPEPSGYAMMLAGLGLMGFVANRRRRHSA